MRITPHCFLIRIANIRPKKGKIWPDVVPEIQKTLDHLDQRLIGKFCFKRFGNINEPVVDLYAAKDQDSVVPAKHAFADLVKDGFLEYIDRGAIDQTVLIY